MIRVFRVSVGELHRGVPLAAPIIEGTRGALQRECPTSALQPAEAQTLMHATADLAPDADVAVVIAADGALFRIFPSEGGPEPDAKRAPLIPWRAQEAGASVLVLDRRPALERLADALCFVGYAATFARWDDVTLAPPVEPSVPRVVVLGPSYRSAELTAALSAVAAPERGIVHVTRPGSAPIPRVDASLPLPLATETFGRLFDAVVRKARGPRGTVVREAPIARR